jgi:predicted anti-sigma-YlaC factor YlaD
MNHARLQPKCERARQWASLRADGELSEFEGLLLAAHLGRCAECRAFRRDVDRMSAALRGSPLEQPSFPIDVPGRRRLGARVVHIGSAAAAAALALAVVLTGGLSTIAGSTRTHSPSSGATTSSLLRPSPDVVVHQATFAAPRAPRFVGRLKAE